ncbi:hypothetical protein ACOME3_004164 [Neoechinorhynchus agilis]
MRQDAILQEVFEATNEIISTKDEILSTYSVIPLRDRIGLVGWCENSISLGTYLEESHPSVQVFFYENLNDCELWCKMQSTYCESLAAGSIVGYILGIGDRHLHNILINKQTAKVIHIDLGIAFEQGRVLSVPERVPFRLTRDLVDGLGILKTDGAFMSTCVRVFDSLKEGKDILLAILNVILNDPLCDWRIQVPDSSLSDLQNTYVINDNHLRKRPRSCSNDLLLEFNDDDPGHSVEGSKNPIGWRALTRVEQKLCGYDESCTSILSTRAQINQLIESATNPCNLCKMYCGWQAYL